VNTVMKIRILYKAGNLLISRATMSLSRRNLLRGVCNLVQDSV
jgi:hypothetical protein